MKTQTAILVSTVAVCLTLAICTALILEELSDMNDVLMVISSKVWQYMEQW